MFGVIYLLLFGVWVVVLNEKIRQGPVPIEAMAARTSAKGLREAAQARTLHQASMSEAKERDPNQER
jgi:hypothetical protein